MVYTCFKSVIEDDPNCTRALSNVVLVHMLVTA